MSFSDEKKDSPVDLQLVGTEAQAESSPHLQLSWGEQFKLLWKSKRAVLTGSIIANKEFVKDFGVFEESVGAWTLPANRQLIWTIVQYVAAILSALG
ncbi:hypothetical protein CNYM01_13307 [Colletotrichum nymphaeae SA-01]|uniref:Uncharacterized protein n=1 Tax=Colletotrichum nymphaeae SA-01 TaxID=1460502 RepID=A0A135S858_9PEZI|nr:hypothetical protein CNYM01_13307 [Colletotrichum nymphaeae SA-01]